MRARAAYESARDCLETTVRERPDDDRPHSALGIAYAGLGRKDDAMRERRKRVDLFPIALDAWKGTPRVEGLAQINVMVGDADAALEQIEHLLSIPSLLSVSLLRIEPRWDPRRNNPRFQTLLDNGHEVF